MDDLHRPLRHREHDDITNPLVQESTHAEHHSSTASVASGLSPDHYDPTAPHSHQPYSSYLGYRRRCSCIPLGSISNLCSATLGAGALSLPYAFSLTGLVPGVMLLLFSGYATVVSIDIIIASCVSTRLYKYEDVSVRLAGNAAGRALEASLLVFCFGTAVAYTVAVGDILDMSLRSISSLWEKNGESYLVSLYSRDRVIVLFWACVMFPLSLQSEMKVLERFSSLGVLSIVFLVVAVVVHSVIHSCMFGNCEEETTTQPTLDEELNETNHSEFSSMLWPTSFWDAVEAFPIIIFAFSCQVNVCAIYEELGVDLNEEDVSNSVIMLKAKQHTMKRITRFGVMLCVVLYMAIGIFGYLEFGHVTVSKKVDSALCWHSSIAYLVYLFLWCVGRWTIYSTTIAYH